MPSIQIVHKMLSDKDRGELLFNGALLVFPRLRSLSAFRERVADLIYKGFGGVDPLTAQDSLTLEDLEKILGTIRQTVEYDDVVRRHALAALSETGVVLEDTYWEKVNLRMLPSGAEHAARGTGWHRDTWGSNLNAQTNWWTPIFPVTAGRTISFAPGYWGRPVANSSSSWSPAAVRKQTEPLIPVPKEPLSEIVELPAVIEPGDLLCFSGAQLNRSTPNTTGLARFSIEIRTVNSTDVQLGYGAANIDAQTPDKHYRWFKHVNDGRALQAPTTPPQRTINLRPNCYGRAS
ncbi:hypothetical protein [Auritidibacter sp. NML100628]|uniref:hypothetical protein n=1 Tax=Auritidibacter sp. NML100628 TaxID=2170742 RepID=UPI000D725A21|nr:hypothetical protein [Auritidibacter sp. NML100628]PXA77086.1 hypothetical protein DCC24_05705 [Auritidibacter sp. NML100628]